MRVLLGCVLLSLAACSSTETKEDLGPSGLPDFDREVSLSTEWRQQVGQGMGKAFARMAPTVDESHIYVSDARGLVQSLALEDGDVSWEIRLDTELTAGVAVGQRFAYVASANGDVIALDKTNGDEVWRTFVKSEVVSLPVEDKDQLALQTVDGHLHLLDVNDGVIKWSYDSNFPSLSIRGTSSPLFNGDQVIAGFANGKVTAVSRLDGSVVWQERIGIPAGRSELERLVDIDGQLLKQDDLLYVIGYQGHLAAIDLRSGKMVWKQEASSYHGPIAGLGNLYMVNDQDHIVALDDRSATEVWEQVDLHGRQLTELVMFANHIAVADYEGYVHLVKQLDGSLVGRNQVVRPPVDWVRGGSYTFKHPSQYFAQDPGVRTKLVVSGKYLVAANNSGYLTVFELEE